MDERVAVNAVVSADANGRITQFNPAAERTFSCAASEVLGTSFTDLLTPKWREPYRLQIEQLFSSEDAAVAGRTIELVGLRKDGTEFPIELCLVTWKAAASSLYTCIVRDISRRRQLERQRDDLLHRVEAMARTDEVTGVANRRAWEEELRRELARATRLGYQIHVVMLDLDRFKEYNDANGHQAGDALLREVGTLWRIAARVTDFLARYGGDEFALLLSDCTDDHAVAVVERLRESLPEGLSCSAGIARWDRQMTADDLVGRADQALYTAKQSGRDEITNGHS